MLRVNFYDILCIKVQKKSKKVYVIMLHTRTKYII